MAPKKVGSFPGVKKVINVKKEHILKQSGADKKTIVKKDTRGGVLGQFSGRITNVGPKFGFIDCHDLVAMGSQVFILKDELRQYKVGQVVQFTAYIDGQERLQGKDLKSGLKNVQNNYMPSNAMSLMLGNSIGAKDIGGGILGEFLGTISKVGPKFGFIECPELTRGQANVFILADELKQYKVGHIVKFTAYYDSQGRLQGKDLKSGLKNSQNSFMPSMPRNLVVPDFGTLPQGALKTIAKKDTAGGVLGQFLGTLSKVGPKFGFIDCPDLAEQGEHSEVFILNDELRQYKVGQKVKFTAYKDGKGRLQGKDLKSGLK